MEILFKMTKEEVERDIDLIVETYRRGSHPTETLRGKRLYNEMIPDELKPLANEVVHMCRTWKRNDIVISGRQAMTLKYLVRYVLAL